MKHETEHNAWDFPYPDEQLRVSAERLEEFAKEVDSDIFSGSINKGAIGARVGKDHAYIGKFTAETVEPMLVDIKFINDLAENINLPSHIYTGGQMQFTVQAKGNFDCSGGVPNDIAWTIIDSGQNQHTGTGSVFTVPGGTLPVGNCEIKAVITDCFGLSREVTGNFGVTESELISFTHEWIPTPSYGGTSQLIFHVNNPHNVAFNIDWSVVTNGLYESRYIDAFTKISDTVFEIKFPKEDIPDVVNCKNNIQWRFPITSDQRNIDYDVSFLLYGTSTPNETKEVVHSFEDTHNRMHHMVLDGDNYEMGEYDATSASIKISSFTKGVDNDVVKQNVLHEVTINDGTGTYPTNFKPNFTKDNVGDYYALVGHADANFDLALVKISGATVTAKKWKVSDGWNPPAETSTHVFSDLTNVYTLNTDVINANTFTLQVRSFLKADLSMVYSRTIIMEGQPITGRPVMKDGYLFIRTGDGLTSYSSNERVRIYRIHLTTFEVKKLELGYSSLIGSDSIIFSQPRVNPSTGYLETTEAVKNGDVLSFYYTSFPSDLDATGATRKLLYRHTMTTGTAATGLHLKTHYTVFNSGNTFMDMVWNLPSENKLLTVFAVNYGYMILETYMERNQTFLTTFNNKTVDATTVAAHTGMTPVFLDAEDTNILQIALLNPNRTAGAV